jgi:DNA-binding Lrp family transcriptional regulator
VDIFQTTFRERVRPSRAGLAMDSLDFAIYRFLSRDGEARFWAGRRVIDPMVTPREIAERVGISESGVRARLLHLAERGFLKDRAVIPNPSLFDERVFVADLLVRQSGEVDRILRDLALVDGVVFTRDVMDEDERKIQVHFVSENDSAASRQAALLGRLSSAGRPVVAQSYYTPPCDHTLSPLDWRVLQHVWRNPEATIGEIAETVGVSLKTAARSYHLLIGSRACWWTHGPGSEEFPLALVRVDLRSPRAREPITGWILNEAPAWMPVASDGFGLEPERGATVLAGLMPADAPTILERFLRKLAGEEGVAKIGRTFPLGSAAYPAWFADRIADRVRVHS